MEELVVKKDFTDIYTQKHPTLYLEEMGNLKYRIPDQTKPLYKHLAERILNYKKRPVRILDLGSSYGINSALLNYELIMSELDDFFVKNKPNPSIISTQNFFEDLPNNDDPNLEFYLVDISYHALDFAEKTGLCKDSFCVNLEKENIPFKLQQTMYDIDLIISTGCVGYIGWKSFTKILENIVGRDPLPIFAFTVLRIFQMDDIKTVFEENNFELLKTKIGPLKQRRFYDKTEMNNTLGLLKSRNINTENLEETGYFFADFYVGGPANIKSHWLSWIQNLEEVFVPIQGN